MDQTQALQNLLNGTASEEDINLLKGGLASGEISIGGNVNNSVLIQGSENNVQVFQLTPEALELLNGRQFLGDLDRDLTGEEIALGLTRLETELPLHAPILLTQFQEQTRCLRPSLKTNPKSLSDHARKERIEALAQVNGLSMEALDISFNALCLSEEPPEYDSRSPFRGLESFRPEDSEFFFGREALTKKLVTKIQSHPFLAVLGASGSGKSSLVMAGLIPALGLNYVIFRPGTNPLEALGTMKENALVVVDQFEELFTLTKDEATRDEFIAKLLETTKRNKVVITLRSDFLGEVAAYRNLNEEVQTHLENVPPMDMDELRRAMEGQAGQVGLRFEADLSQQILDDVDGEPGAMPLLQHALWELWNRRHGRNLRASEYRAFGGVRQAITSTAEKVYGECTKAEREQMRDIFLRLTRLDDSDEGRDTRRHVTMNDLIPSGQDVALITLLLDQLANARLIVKTVIEDKTEIEVAHEALIRHWERLRDWLNEDRDNLRLRESVSEAAKEWEQAGKNEALLNHRGGRLDDALKLRSILTSREQAYLAFCVNTRDQVERRRKRLVKSLSIGLLIMLLIAIFAGFQWQRAEQQKRISRAGELAAVAANKQNENIALAHLLSIESINTYNYYQSRKVLLDNFYIAKPLRGIFLERNVGITSVTISPNGKTIAYATLGSYNVSTIILRDSVDRKIIGQPIEIHGRVYSLQFNSNSKLLMIGGAFGVDVWDIESNKQICRTGIFSNNNKTNQENIFSDVTSVAFSPDNHTIAYSKRGEVYVFSLNSDYCRYAGAIPFFSHSHGINSIAFDPTGHILAVGGDDKAIILLDSSTGKMVGQPLRGHTDRVTDIEFSPDGKALVSGSEDKTIILWDIGTHTLITQSLIEHAEGITDVEFNANGNVIASSSTDNTIVIWDAKLLTPLYSRLIGHTDSVTSLSFGPENNLLISGGLDGALIRWDVSGDTVLNVLHLMKVDNLSQMELSPDGKLISIGKTDGTVLFINPLTSETPEEILSVHPFEVTSIKFSNNGKIMVTSSCHQFDEHDICTQSEMIFWDTQSRQLLGEPLLSSLSDFIYSGITSIGFSPDDKFLIAINCGLQQNGDIVQYCNRGEVNIWDVDNKKEIWNTLGVNSYTTAFNPKNNYFALGGCQLDTFGICDKGTVWINLLMPNTPGLPWAIGRDWSWSIAHDGLIYSLEFNKDGTRLASGGEDGSIVIWDTSKFDWISKLPVSSQYALMEKLGESQPIQPLGEMLDKHSDAVTSLSFSQDGRFLASSSLDHKILLWDVNSRQLLGELYENQQNKIVTIDFTSDGKNLVFGNTNGEIGFMNINIADWIRMSCNIVGRNFTRSEWAKYFPDEEYRATCPQWPLEPEPTPTP